MTKNFKPQAWFLPQPVIIIGTYDADGIPNAMNAAWAGQWDQNEIVISLGNHATTQNLSVCPEFTVAFATADTEAAADYVGLVSGKKVHYKVAITGWKSDKAANVNAPVFDVFPMTMECRIKEKLHESETGCYVIAEIVNIVCKEEYLAEDGNPDVEKMKLITYDPIHHTYIGLGQTVGKAFHDGLVLREGQIVE